MDTRRQKTTYLSVSMVVRQTGLSRDDVEQCLALGLVREPLGTADLADLRRIRRLRELGVNLAGIEVVLHMRRRMQALRTELTRWEQTFARPSLAEPEDQWQRLLPWEPDRE